MGFESSGFEEASGYVVGQVPKSQGDPAEVFEASVDRFGWAVAGAWAVEEGEHVGRPSVEGPAQADELDEVSRDAGADRVDHALKEEPSKLLVGIPVSHDESLVDTPCRVDLGVLFVGEQCLQSGDLLVGE